MSIEPLPLFSLPPTEPATTNKRALSPNFFSASLSHPDTNSDDPLADLFLEKAGIPIDTHFFLP